MKASRGPRIEPALACDPGRSIHLWLLKIQNRSIWRENSLFLEKFLGCGGWVPQTEYFPSIKKGGLAERFASKFPANRENNREF
jgi:hypothetical protein